MSLTPMAAERVAVVGTINRYRPRSALSDIAKAHGLEPAKVRELANQLPHAFWVRFETSADGKPASPFAALRAAYPSPTYQTIFDEAEAILKLPRHLSMHPGGVIVAPGALTDLVPVMRSGGKGIDHHTTGSGVGRGVRIGEDRPAGHSWSDSHG